MILLSKEKAKGQLTKTKQKTIFLKKPARILASTINVNFFCENVEFSQNGWLYPPILGMGGWSLLGNTPSTTFMYTREVAAWNQFFLN